MDQRKIKLSWKELQDILQKAGITLPEEEIREMTLVKPKEILIYLKR